MLIHPDWSKMPQPPDKPALWEAYCLRYDRNFSEKRAMASIKSKYIRYLKKLDFRILFECDKREFSRLAEFMTEFFSCFTEETQLNTFILEAFDLAGVDDLDQLDFVSRLKLWNALVHFLRTQKSLKILKFRGYRVTSYEGLKMLKAAVKNCEETLEVLVIEDFITDYEHEGLYQCPKFMDIISSLRSLRKFKIRYCDINPTVLQVFGENLGPKLERLSIVCYDMSSESEISWDDWAAFKRRCVNAKVKFNAPLVYGCDNLSDPLPSVLLGSMPLDKLRCQCDYTKEDPQPLSFFLKYLGTHFSQTLKSVDLRFRPAMFDLVPTLEDALNFLIGRCSKLEYFYFRVKKGESADIKNKLREMFSERNIKGLHFDE